MKSTHITIHEKYIK